MNKSDSSGLEANRINEIANEYRKKGYIVTTQPSSEEMPNFLKDYRPDIVARGADESVIIEVKRHSNLTHQSEVSRLAEIVQNHAGWRFELVITNPKGSTLIASDSRLPTTAEVSKRLTEARKLVNRGNIDASILLAWSAAEGLLRLSGEKEHILLDRQSSSFVLKNAYSLGLIDNSSYQVLSNFFKLRNSVIHGYIEPNVSIINILNLIETVRKMLNNYKRRLTVCKCPVCGKKTAHVGTLFSHLLHIHDDAHRLWLESYCVQNRINFGRLLVDRVQNRKDANKPLTDALKRDYCENC